MNIITSTASLAVAVTIMDTITTMLTTSTLPQLQQPPRPRASST